MQTVLLVVHLMIASALVGVVLLQKSEGGALGIGGGGGGFLSGRGQANLLTRVTAGLALAFFISSIGLSLAGRTKVAPSGSVFDQTAPASTAPAAPGTTAPATDATPGATAPAAGPTAPATATAPVEPAAPRGGILDKLQ